MFPTPCRDASVVSVYIMVTLKFPPLYLVEVCQRLDSALPSITHSMLSYLSPWLLNIELVNPNIPDSTFLPQPFKSSDTVPRDTEHRQRSQTKTLLEGEGWGSSQATEMVLNNLMYVTVKVGTGGGGGGELDTLSWNNQLIITV